MNNRMLKKMFKKIDNLFGFKETIVYICTETKRDPMRMGVKAIGALVVFNFIVCLLRGDFI